MKITLNIFILLISFSLMAQKGKITEDSKSYEGPYDTEDWTKEDFEKDYVKDSISIEKDYKESVKYARPDRELMEYGLFSGSKYKRRAKRNNRLYKKELEEYKRDSISYWNHRVEYLDYIKRFKNYKIKELKRKKIEKKKRLEQKRKGDSIEAIKEREKEIKDSIKRVKDSIEYAKKQEKLRKKIANMPNNPDYISWKRKMESHIRKSEIDIKRCRNIIKKYNYRNAFGQKMYDYSDFSKSDKTKYQKNLKLLKGHIDSMSNLKDENETFYWYWNDRTSNENKMALYRFSNYWRDKSYDGVN